MDDLSHALERAALLPRTPLDGATIVERARRRRRRAAVASCASVVVLSLAVGVTLVRTTGTRVTFAPGASHDVREGELQIETLPRIAPVASSGPAGPAESLLNPPATPKGPPPLPATPTDAPPQSTPSAVTEPTGSSSASAAAIAVESEALTPVVQAGEKLRVRFQNTGEVAVGYGSEHHYERWDGEQWVPADVPCGRGGICAWELIKFSIEPGEAREHEYATGWVAAPSTSERLLPGRHRVLVEMQAPAVYWGEPSAKVLLTATEFEVVLP